jgi:hypothetical protein
VEEENVKAVISMNEDYELFLANNGKVVWAETSVAVSRNSIVL